MAKDTDSIATYGDSRPSTGLNGVGKIMTTDVTIGSALVIGLVTPGGEESTGCKLNDTAWSGAGCIP